MATSPMRAYRAADAEIPFRGRSLTAVPRMTATTLDADIDDGRGAARGILVGLLLSVPFWVGVYAMLS